MEQIAPALRRDYKAVQAFLGDERAADRLRVHYELERGLAQRLLIAPTAERPRIYNEVYAELFRSLPDHPQRSAAKKDARPRHIERLLACLAPFFDKGSTFLEIGCGDGALAAAVAARVAQSYALDVTDALIDRSRMPQNLRVLITDSVNIPLPDNSIDCALSDQLMEHLHPDDAHNQLSEIFRVLRPDGKYCCMTPNRVTGPHDISCLFGYVAAGFHLREYDSSQLLHLLRRAGFRRVHFFMPAGHRKVPLPWLSLRALELTLLSMPDRLRGRLARCRALGVVAGLNVIATK